jgi:hypothetical protein
MYRLITTRTLTFLSKETYHYGLNRKMAPS